MSRRNYQLGLDWGTSSTKLVLRDYDDPSGDYGRAWILALEREQPRYPSNVALVDGRIWFGFEALERRERAGQVWDSLKADFALRGAADPIIRHLSSAYLAHVLHHTRTVAARLAWAKNAEADLRVTVGVPTADLQVRSERYLRAVVLADMVSRRMDPQGARLEALVAELDGRGEVLDERIQRLDPRRLDVQYDRWLRGEAFAAMVWMARSPQVPAGPYTVIDIGAATTNATWFRICERWTDDGVKLSKGQLVFSGAATRPTGMDVLDNAIGEATDRPAAAIRTNETKYLDGLVADRSVEAALLGPKCTWAEARRKMWHKDGRLNLWEGLGIVTVGGGSFIPQVVAPLTTPPGYLGRNLDQYETLRSPGRPPDLLRLDGSRSRAPGRRFQFHLAAYGLSFRAGDLPDVTYPQQLKPFRFALPVRDMPTSEELGYDDR